AAFVVNITPKFPVNSGPSWPSPAKVSTLVETARPLAPAPASWIETCAVTPTARPLTWDSAMFEPTLVTEVKMPDICGAVKSVTKLNVDDHGPSVPTTPLMVA